MNTVDFQLRFEIAERYLAYCAEGQPTNWNRLARKALRHHDVPLAMSLIHPDNLPLQQFAHRDPRAFSTTIDPHNAVCEAHKFWGVACGETENLHADHDWPYSLGGPTNPANLTWLCRVHNLCKGADIHCWPWELMKDPPNWVSDILETA